MALNKKRRGFYIIFDVCFSFYLFFFVFRQLCICLELFILIKKENKIIQKNESKRDEIEVSSVDHGDHPVFFKNPNPSFGRVSLSLWLV